MGEYEGGAWERLPTDVDLVSCEGARETEVGSGCRAMDVEISFRVSIDGASSSSLCCM